MSGKEDNPRPRRAQIGLGRIMGAVALIALFLGFLRLSSTPEGRTVLFSIFLASIVAVASLALGSLSLSVVEAMVGIRCPSCGKPGMQRRSVRPFFHQYYLCPACGARRKRWGSGHRWRDASLAHDDRWYQPRRPAHPWIDHPDAVPDDAELSGTTGDLLRNKRHRPKP